MTIVSTTVGKNPIEEMDSSHNQQERTMLSLGTDSKRQNDLGPFPRQTIQHHSNPSLCPTTNVKEVEVEQFYEDV